MRRVGLYGRSIQPQCFQPLPRLPPEFVLAHAARHDAIVAQQLGHIREIRRRATKLSALRENIPEQFSQPHHGVLFGHSPTEQHLCAAATHWSSARAISASPTPHIPKISAQKKEAGSTPPP